MVRCRVSASLALVALLSACGSDGGSSTSGATADAGGSTSGSTTSAGCTLRDRQDWAFAQLKEWYLFPETLPASLDPTPYTTVDAYIDALTAAARAQSKDRYFTYLTSIASENAYYNSGSSAGFGVRLSYDNGARRVFVSEAFEGAPALAAGIDRGTEIVAIGTSTANVQTVSSLMASNGATAVTDALGPNTAGTTRLLRVVTGGVQRDVTVAKADYSLTPVSSRYGAQVITENGAKYGYVNLRTFITTADPALRAAFQTFRDQGVTNIVVDLRYNGGGLVSIAELLSNLLGAQRTTSDVQSYTTFRTEKSSNNTTTFFAPQSQSVATTRVAFIGTGGTASASEYVINAFTPYLHASSALIGTNTYGKPVGQIAIDKAACDDRLRVIAFALQNAARQGAYYTGLANYVEASCQAGDDVTYPLGDPREASTRAALDFLQGKSCTRIAEGTSGTLALREGTSGKRELLIPDHPNTPQREVPGLF